MDTNNETHEVYDMGWWPEIFGSAAFLTLVWYLITFARGIF